MDFRSFQKRDKAHASTHIHKQKRKLILIIKMIIIKIIIIIITKKPETRKYWVDVQRGRVSSHGERILYSLDWQSF